MKALIDFFLQHFIAILFCLILLNLLWKYYKKSELSLRVNVVLFQNNAEHHFILGYYLFNKNKDLERAENELRRAITLTPNDDRYFLALAYILHLRGKYLEAVHNYRQVIKLNPQSGDAYLNIGLLFHEKLNRFDEAEQAYRRAIELNPTFPENYFQLGWLLLDRLHRYTEAESMFIKTLELNPQDETALYNLACIKSFSRDSDLTFEYLRKAIEKGFDQNWAWNDKDLEWLQNDLRFTEIVGPRPSKD
jgi:tetratricopeptide (TPR) repeat protein